MKHALTLLFAAIMLTLSPSDVKAQQRFEVGENTFLLDGKPMLVKAAELHYPRIPRPYWEHRIKMCKALGMNAICMYVFWNIHETEEGVYDFSGQNDVVEFCRLAQKHGMWVIVRPGPYVCAEWEIGGLPWWLLRKNNIRLREQDPYFMQSVGRFMGEVGKRLAPLTINRGGPIIMVQVENEYGSYGTNKPYVAAIRDTLRSVGFDDVTLFQCDWSTNFEQNGLDDLVWTMNFGTGADVDEQFRRLNELRPTAPKMCSEYWSGWFDKWGARHETRPADEMVAGIEQFLKRGISFSLYMTHGGTSFGHWAGANSPGFAPDVTSYDYDAPINEYGMPTQKYWLLRNTMQKYSDKVLPAVPRPAMPRITIPTFALSKVMDTDAMVTKRCYNVTPLTMEQMGVGYGMVKYSTTLPRIPSKSLLTLEECHDFAMVYVNDSLVGTIDRVRGESQMALPAVNKGDRLTILVEAMGRINFGRAINDRKGITRAATISTESDGHLLNYELRYWTMEAIADDYAAIRQAITNGARGTAAMNGGYYKGSFNVKRVGDTFLRMDGFGKGQVWVNGHALGRYWNIGPQQTLYLPGCWMKRGENEVVVLDILGPTKAECSADSVPETDHLNLPEGSRYDKKKRPNLSHKTPAATGTLSDGSGWQTVTLPQTREGRYVALLCQGTHRDEERAAIAELYLLDNEGQRIPREQWTTLFADSEDSDGNHTGDKAYDQQESTYWQQAADTSLPQVIVIDMGDTHQVSALQYLPRAEQGSPGAVSDYSLYVW